ncbi:hypothetical protein BKA63DRAFT_565804 [Paraphoma chrysanthemicola]|nr:hypothetical protein BKA63DRAFT_565804 [Paraphoma chrysanthemicola]
MPSTKRRRTNRDASKSNRRDSGRSSSVSPKPSKVARKDNNENKENEDTTKPSRSVSPSVKYVDPLPHSDCGGGVLPGESDGKAPYEYVCIHRPLFDIISENWRLASKGKVKRLDRHGIYEKKYEPGFIAENKKKIWGAPPEEHQRHKWITMMLDFDKAFRNKGGHNLDQMWAIISAVGLWINVEDIPTTPTNAAHSFFSLAVTTLSGLAQPGELHPKSRFLDLALVIGHYLELSHDLPNYGIEGACVSWRREAVKLFHRAKLDPKKGLYDTPYRLKQLEKASNYDEEGHDNDEEDHSDQELLHHEHGTESDPWAWRLTMDQYRKSHMAAAGRYPHDITKLTRAQRGAYCFDERDPLADVPVKDLRNNLLDFVR